MFWAFLCSCLQAALVISVSGRVIDQTGAAIPGATVVARGTERHTITDGHGRFTLRDVQAGRVLLIVRAPGFAEWIHDLNAATDQAALEIVLEPAALLEAVTVTASRGASARDTSAATSVLSASVLQSTGAAMLDDQLKTVPGFSLFRRTSSRVANPTAQGVTMRGLSASGASRSLVLVDGVVLNDAFGGWVYWNRVPQTALDRIEVVRGGTSDVYGADAVGGVIQALTFVPTRTAGRASLEFGSRDTTRLSLLAGSAGRGWKGFLSGEWHQTDGYIIVSPDERGPVDTAAGSEYQTLYGVAGYDRGPWRAVMRANVFSEDRANGTPLQNNATASRTVVLELGGTLGSSTWLARGYGGSQGYDQTFSAVTAGRASEALTQIQRVPSRSGGATAQWTRFVGAASWMVGGDVRRVSGATHDRAFTRGIETGTSRSGGVRWDGGVFARTELFGHERVTFVGAVRVDRWSVDPDADGAASQALTQFSPKAGISWRPTPSVSVHGVATHAFRAPTLNELFRGFRVGNTVTNANDRLTPEKLGSFEGSVRVVNRTTAWRVVGFWNRLSDAIANVTLSATPQLITRQRTNAGTIRATGAEIEGECQLTARVRASVGAAFIDSIFSKADEPGLTGNRVPQVPEYQLAAGVRVQGPASVLATAQFRMVGPQFEDDRNQLLLDRATVIDVFAERAFKRGFQIFGAVENLFDDQYDVGRTPIRTIGLPRTGRVGVRWSFH